MTVIGKEEAEIVTEAVALAIKVLAKLIEEEWIDNTDAIKDISDA